MSDPSRTVRSYECRNCEELRLNAGHPELITECVVCKGKPKKAQGSYVGMPAYLKLEQFGTVIREAFPEGTPFLVGSALRHHQWRDVDVRLMLPDADFARIIGPLTKPRYLNPRWNALCVAFSVYGQHLTGLPIDFQIGDTTHENTEYGGQPRSAIGVMPGVVGCVDHATGEKVTSWD